MSTYSAPQSLVNVNKWPRYAITGGAPATNNFNADFTTTNGRAYLIGAVSIGAIFFILAILLLVILALANVIVCCCCKGTNNTKRAAEKRTLLSMLTSATAIWLGTVVLICALSLAAVSQGAAISTFGAQLLMTSGAVAAGIAAPLANATATATAFCSIAPSQNPPPTQQVLSAICALPGPLSTAATATGSVALSLSATSTALTGQLAGGGTLDLSKIAKQVYTGGVTLIAIFAAYILSTTLGLIRTKFCANTGFRICNCFLIIVVAGVFVVTGVFAIVGVVGSDVCTAPSPAFASVANMTTSSGGGDTINTVLFYTTCDPTVTYTAAPGAYGAFLAGQAQIANATAAVTALAQIVPTYPWAQPYVTGLTVALQTAGGTTAVVGQRISCGPIAAIINNILTAMCNKGIVGSVMLFQLCAAVCAFIATLAILAVTICKKHPGAEHATEEPAKGSEAPPGVLTVRAVV